MKSAANTSSPPRRCSGILASAAILILSVLLAPALMAGQNPFEQVAADAYTGRFVGPDVTIRLTPEGGKWTGTIIFKGKNYTIQGASQDGKLTGTFGEGDQSWPFTAMSDGDNLTFTAGTFTTKLQRQKLPKLEGVYASKRVKLDFQNKDGSINGTITFNGKEYQFSATEAAGDLEGVFKNGDEAFKFTLANDPVGLTFQTGQFADAVSWKPQRQKATPLGNVERWTNSLGMVLAKVPGTDVLFSIWDTRVQDYQVYAENSQNVATFWKNPGFAQGANHPVVAVSWNDAKAFCLWLTEQERADGLLTASQSYRLPTDAEWSVAVGLQGESGSTPAEKNEKIKGVYPWGTQWPPPNRAGNYAASLGVDNFTYTSPVGSFAANQFGLYDMGGNVWQWCEDWFNSDQKFRVLRGASWYDNSPGDLLSSCRYYSTPGRRDAFIGFRVVLGGASSR